MIGRSVATGLLMIMAGGCAVTMPAQYMGVATGIPVSSEDRVRIEAALADGSGAKDGCPWETSGQQVPCALLPVSQLAGLAWSGNRRAALELGIRFEEGRGVPADRDKARLLYQAAALRTGGTNYVYSPGVGDQPGRLVPYFPPEEPGLPEARARLLALDGKASTPASVKVEARERDAD